MLSIYTPWKRQKTFGIQLPGSWKVLFRQYLKHLNWLAVEAVSQRCPKKNRTVIVPESRFNKDTGVLTVNFTKCLNKTLFYSIQYKNGCFWLFSYVFTQSIKFYTFYYHVLKKTDVWQMWFISKNEWLLLSASFVLVFVLTLGNAFS